MPSLPPAIDSMEKARIFFAELEPLNIYPNSLLTDDEILRALDHKLGSQFDRHISEQLFEQMTPDVTNRYYMEDFCSVWVKATDILRQKVEKSDEYLDDNIENREEATRKLDECKRTERLNANGIMQGSTLSVTLEVGESFVDVNGQAIDSYVVFTCGRNSFSSMITNNPNQFTFKQDFTFPIDYGNEVLKIEVFDSQYPEGMKKAESYAEMPLSKLDDQSKINEWVQLRFPDGRLSQTRLNQNLQWIFSKVNYLTQVIKKWDHHILDEQKNYQSFVHDLNTLYQPFFGLNKQVTPLQASQHVPYNPDPVANKDERGFKQVATSRFSCSMVILFWAMIAWWILSLMNCYYKASFLDVMLSMMYLSSVYFSQPEMNQQMVYIYMGAIGFSMVLDIVWQVLYWTGWWYSSYVDDSLLSGLRKYIQVMTIILLVVKAALIGLLFFVNRYIKKETKLVSQPLLGGVPMKHDSPDVNVMSNYGMQSIGLIGGSPGR